MARYKYNKIQIKRSSHKSSTGHNRSIHNQSITTLFNKSLLAAAIGTLLSQNCAQANPVGGKVVAGSANIVQESPGQLQIIQNSNKAIIDWRGFSIARGEHTRFRQPSSSSIALNRVRGGQASLIDGALTANGNVWLINPNGVLFGKGAQVNVRGLIATTSDINNEDFMAGRYAFDKPTDNIDAAIVNQGRIEITDGGSIVLAAHRVSNKGSIKARLGHVVLASGDTFTMDFDGDGLLQFDIGDPVQQSSSEDKTGALVSNSGKITVDGGIVEMTAKTRNTMVERVINMEGVVQARAVDVKGGTIILSGGETGIVEVSGTLDVSGKEPDKVGGEVKVLGEKVGLFDGAEIDASGDAGGGEVLVGGGFQGKGAEPNARRTLVADNSEINADALTKGDGGKVIVWSDEITAFSGNISAKGGKNSGDGGLVEVSGKQELIFRGQVDLNSAKGKKGSLLLDPFDINIRFQREFTNDNEINDNKIFADDNIPGAGPSFTISEQKLESISGKADIIMEASNNISIRDLSDGILAFNASTGSVTFSADADKDGRGTFSLSDVELQTQGGNLTIETADMSDEGLSSGIITKGGDINLISRDNFDMGFLSLNSSSSGAGGNISVQVSDDFVLTGRPLNIDSSGRIQGGNVSLTSNTGIVDIGRIDASSERGAGGKININAQGGVSTEDLTSTGASAGRNISLKSNTGIVEIGRVDASSERGPGGKININAQGGISTGDLTSTGASAGGNVSFTSNTGIVEIGRVDASSERGAGGKININAQGGISTGDLTSTGNIAGGDVHLNSTTGDIDTAFAIEFSPLNPINTSATKGSGGDVILNAAGKIRIGGVNTTGSSPSNGGNINLTANEIDLTNVLVSSGGSLLFQPDSPSQNIVIGGDRDSDFATQAPLTSTLDITKSDLGFIIGPFDSLTIGRDNGSGNITIDPAGANFNQTTVIRSPATTGNLVLEGAIQTDGKDLTFVAGNSIKFSNDVSTKGGNLSINGDSVLTSATKISTAGGDLDFNGQINSADKPADLTLLAETGDIQFNDSVGTEKPLGSVSIESANNVTVNSKFVAGKTNVIHKGDFTTGPDGFLELESLFVNPQAKSANLKGTVAGAAEKETALVVDGPKDDPNFKINDCVVGISCPDPDPDPGPDPAPDPGPDPAPEANLDPELPTEAEPRPDNSEVTDISNVKPGETSTSPEVLTVIQTRRPSNNPVTYQYSNFGNTEMWDDVPGAYSISSFAAFSPVATEKDKKDEDDSDVNEVEKP